MHDDDMYLYCWESSYQFESIEDFSKKAKIEWICQAGYPHLGEMSIFNQTRTECDRLFVFCKPDHNATEFKLFYFEKTDPRVFFECLPMSPYSYPFF